MAKQFKESVFSKSDYYFVPEDPARIYRDLREMLEDEFDMDRIEEGFMEFSNTSPKDRIRLHAFKEKSPHTVLHFSLSWKAKPPKGIYKQDRDDDILKARVKVSADVSTSYPGADFEPYLPEPVIHGRTVGTNTGVRHEDASPFQKTKLYDFFVTIWHELIYSTMVEKYEHEAEEIATRIHDMMRKRFGAEETIHRKDGPYNAPWKG